MVLFRRCNARKVEVKYSISCNARYRKVEV